MTLSSDANTGAIQHRAGVVYAEMLTQICMDLGGLPDPRELTIDEILFFYNRLRPSLHKATASKTASAR